MGDPSSIRIPFPYLEVRYAARTFRTIGVAAANQNLLTIENPAASTRIVRVDQVKLNQVFAALSADFPLVKLTRTVALPTGGTVIPEAERQLWREAAQAIVRGGTASDAGVATAITAVASGTPYGAWIGPFNMSAAGQALSAWIDLLEAPVFLNPGEALLARQTVAADAAMSFLLGVDWAELKSS